MHAYTQSHICMHMYTVHFKVIFLLFLLYIILNIILLLSYIIYMHISELYYYYIL